MCRKRISFIIFIGLVSFLFLLEKSFAERIYLDITASDTRKIVVAVPSFSSTTISVNPQKGKDMSELLSQALEFHGFIDIVDPSRYGGVKGATWQALGVDYVVIGNYTELSEMIQIEGQLLDVSTNKLMAGRRYKGSVGQKDEMVLRLADTLIEEFTGEPGISRTRIAYTSDQTGRKEVYLSDILGKNQRQVTRHKLLCVSPRFTPDGNYLAYSTYHKGNQNLYITDLRQDKITRSYSRRKGLNLGPAFSPDGRHMIVTLSIDGTPDLYLLDRNNGEILNRLTSRAGINVSPSYSPDGNKVVFVSDRSGKPQIYTMELASKKTKRLTFERSENSEPVWSPKGDLIAFTGLVDGHYHIFTMDIQGGKVKRLTDSWGDYESPSWSPDGKMLALTRKRNGKSDICVIGKNGKGLNVLFPFKGNKSFPQWSPRL